eukprot:4439358-Amphidinium_carterae.4
MADLLEDEKIRRDGWRQRSLMFFNDMGTQHLRLAFDKTLYSGARAMQYAVRKRIEFPNFELHHEAIGELIKGKMRLRHARFEGSQLRREHTWLKSDRQFKSVFEALT